MSAKISFRVVPHSTRPVELVEIMFDGMVVAVIYPEDGLPFFTVVSAHLARVDMIDGPDSRWGPVPAVGIMLDPQPYVIVDGKIVKQAQQ